MLYKALKEKYFFFLLFSRFFVIKTLHRTFAFGDKIMQNACISILSVAEQGSIFSAGGGA